ncbi:hypothetical protein [Variovorax sp. 350MFTsu5.1]|uniref:hypothetical protein n=1 Tax=Variovorax sp. 350MFTsu5.1 TaxID=3158365 RepID=UPI003AADCACD
MAALLSSYIGNLFSKVFAGDAPPLHAAKGRAGIHPWLQVGEQVNADVLADGKAIARLEHTATLPGLKKLPSVVFELPENLSRLELRGSHVDAQGKATSFRRRWSVLDMARISHPLYDPARPLVERIRAFAELSGLVEVGNARLPAGTNAEAEAALLEAEARLGTTLPSPLRVLLAEADIRIDNSYFLQPHRLQTAEGLLLGLGGYGDGNGGFDALLPPTVLSRYRRSVAVFVEIGDGLGALAWDPEGVVPNEPSNTTGDHGNPGAQPATPNEGVWYWLHQERIAEPELLLDDDYRPQTAEAALTGVFKRFALSQADSPETEKQLLIDTAHPRNLLQLSFDEPKKPRLWMRSYDYHYSLY